jgi:hypothetical protein
MSDKSFTLEDFNTRIVRPMVLAGIKRGDFDGILAQMLEEHAAGEIKFDDETLKAMLRRAFIVATMKPWPWWDSSVPKDAKIGTQIKIKLPDDYKHTAGFKPIND